MTNTLTINKKAAAERTTSPDAKRKKQLDADLTIIGVVTFIVMALVLAVFGKEFNAFVSDKSVLVLARTALAAICGQFGLAGLGGVIKIEENGKGGSGR